LMTTRRGGFSAAPFDSMNLRDGLGDDPKAVQCNQRLLAEAIGATPVYLNQVHGATVARLVAADAAPDAALQEADASVTTERGIACAVQVADCLPVLLAAPGGVGAAHAGWRGLAGGVIEATVRALCEAAACEPARLHAWLGACIGPGHFEVGPDVLQAFGAAPETPGDRFRAKAAGKWLADLPSLARDRLLACGVAQVSGGHWCTVADASRFFSFRRDKLTGRMAALVWRRG
ncbi:MAG TPA: peptidoglycan editing factor PgeF, partial [Albitalea sp.]|nr:peptidoglycan editing factor PgeF [Albitalea sp.]